MQFFQHLGQWLTLDQIKKIRAKEKKEKEIICPYCVTRSPIKHLKGCPTLENDFNKETAVPLTSEEREELLKNKK
jgi:hypothetical protein